MLPAGTPSTPVAVANRYPVYTIRRWKSSRSPSTWRLSFSTPIAGNASSQFANSTCVFQQIAKTGFLRFPAEAGMVQRTQAGLAVWPAQMLTLRRVLPQLLDLFQGL